MNWRGHPSFVVPRDPPALFGANLFGALALVLSGAAWAGAGVAWDARHHAIALVAAVAGLGLCILGQRLFIFHARRHGADL